MILIYGKGKTGEAVKDFLDKRGIENIIVDDKDTFPENLDIKEIVVSPGIPFNHKIFKYAKKNKIPILSEIEFAYRYFKGEIVAITGTDGKTTTTSLIYETLKNKDVFIGGNYGIPFISIVDKNQNGLAILELSSFQIYSTYTFRPKIAIILNISTDHLDWHKKEKHYKLSKLKLFKNQNEEDFAILNYDDEYLRNIKPKSKLYYFSLKEEVNGIYLVDRKKEYIFNVYNLILKDGNLKKEIQVKTQLVGLHNLQNIMACILTGYLLRKDLDVILKKLENFKSLPHRIEFVRKIGNVEFYNDSKSTTVQAVEKAVESFDNDVVLILGGINKGGDFSKISDIAKSKIKKAFIIGRDKKQIKGMIDKFSVGVLSQSLEEAVYNAYNEAKNSNATVLFSPGCASFDMFKNYADRGDKYKKIVMNLDG